MDYKEVKKDSITSSLIEVEALQKEYEVTLQSYQEAVNNYIASLDDKNSSSFVTLNGRAWWGAGKLSEGEVNTKEECETMCANSDKCSGATFNQVKRYCWTRTGDGNLTPGETDDFALLPKQKSALIIMKSLNEKLLDLNEKITANMKKMEPDVKEQIIEKNNTYKELDNSYQNLLEQKVEMERQLQEYYSIEQDYDNQVLYVNQQQLSMKFWVLVCAIILLVTITKMYGSPPPLVTMLLIIFIFIVVFTYLLKTPVGFVLLFVVLMVIFTLRSSNESS